MIRTRVRQTTAGLDPGIRPWPGITAPRCEFCSWAYRGRWPLGRMEVKFVNGMCSTHWRAVTADELWSGQ